MTFGRPDGNYWDYPQTPSVSVAGYDWVSFGEGAYLSYGSTANTFCAGVERSTISTINKVN
jgi:hypothetical protein